jgi:hypothetical protein
MATTAPWRTPRVYTDPKGRGRRLNVAGAAEALGLRPGTFWRLQQEGFYQWQGPDLSPQRIASLTLASEGSQSEETFLESEVLQLRDVLRSPAEERYAKVGRVNREMVGRRLGISAASAHANGRFAEWEQEGKLTPSITKSPMTGKKEVTYPAAQLDALAVEYAAKRERFRSRDGEKYIPTAEVCARLGVTPNTLYLWRRPEQGCTPLGGEPLDCFDENAPYGGKECWYEDSQVERIRLALDSRRACRASGELCRFTEEHLIDGESYLTLTAVYKGRGLSERVPWQVVKRLVEKGFLNTEKVRARSRGGRRTITVYHKGQIQKYLEERTGSCATQQWNLMRCTVRPTVGWNP